MRENLYTLSQRNPNGDKLSTLYYKLDEFPKVIGKTNHT